MARAVGKEDCSVFVTFALYEGKSHKQKDSSSTLPKAENADCVSCVTNEYLYLGLKNAWIRSMLKGVDILLAA